MSNIERPRPHNTACICANCQAVRNTPSARAVNLYGLTDGPHRIGPVESQWIRDRWRALGGHFLVARPCVDSQRVHDAVITEESLFAAVRAGRIRL
jgi:hypothetical protein